MSFYLRKTSFSDKGTVREENQDSYVTGESSFAVFDGMGGESCGAEASGIAADIYNRYLSNRPFSSEEDLRNAVLDFSDESQKAIWQMLDRNAAMHGGTTAAGISFFEKNALVYYIGDSRVYLLRKGRLFLLSHDMTAAQQEIDKGSLNPGEAKKTRGWHLLTSYLGDGSSVIRINEILEIEPEDRLFLCTDGVTDAISDDRLENILRCRPQFLVKWLIRRYVMKHGDDNFTFILIDVNRD